MSKQYKAKHLIVEAMQWTGLNTSEIIIWTHGLCRLFNGNGSLLIETPNGQLYANINDYIIKDASGEVFIRKDDTFNQYYEEIN